MERMGFSGFNNLATATPVAGPNPQVYFSSSINNVPKVNKVTCQPYKMSGFITGSRIADTKGSFRTGEPSLSGVLFSSLYSAQEVRGLSPSHRPQAVEQVYSLSSFSHGIRQGNSGSTQSGGMDNKCRFIRCLPPYSHSPDIQEISQAAHQRSIVPVCSNVFWPEYSTTNIYQAPGSGCFSSPFPGHLSSSVSGRLAHQRPVSSRGVRTHRNSSPAVLSSRTSGQSTEVGPYSQNTLCVSGHGCRLTKGLDSPHGGPGYQNIGISEVSGVLQSQSSTASAIIDRMHESRIPVCPFGAVTSQAPPILCQGLGTQSEGGYRFLNTSGECLPQSSGVVEGPGLSLTGCTSTPPGASRDSGNRCQSARLGSISGRPQTLRFVDKGGVQSSHNSAGIEGRDEGLGNGATAHNRQEHSALMRQYGSSGIHPERGRDTFSFPVPGDKGHPALVFHTQSHPAPILSTGSSQLCCRSPLQIVTGSRDRMDLTFGSFPTDLSTLPRPGCGSFRNESQSPAPSVHQSLSGPSSVESGCLQFRVGGDDAVCVPPIQAGPRSPPKAKGITNTNDPHSTSLAESVMVSRPSEPAVRPPTGASSLATVTAATTGPGISSQPTVVAPSRLATIRSRIRQAGFSRSVARYAAASQRPSSLRLYQSHWNTFSAWCEEWDIDPVVASVQQIADFLVYLFEVKKYAPSTIANYRSSIASALGDIDGVPLSLHPCLSKLIKAFSSSRRIERPRVPEWDLSRVLRILRSQDFEPPQWTSRQDRLRCTWKTIFLLALASTSRCSELQAISRDPRDLIFSDRGMSMRVVPGFLAKTAVPGMDPVPFFIPSLEPFSGRDSDDRLLCPVRMVRKYLKFTGGLTPKERLFRKVRGEGPPSSQTIASWIKACVRHTHQHRQNLPVTAHQVRRMSASWAFHGGVHSVGEILQAGTWASHSTFTSFYLADVKLQPDGQHRMHPVVARKQLSRF